jgi:oligopeptide/dipeptide ABC transporter ATP-binding protein
MYAGRVVEQAPVADIFREPRHPYTSALMAADPHRAVDARGERTVVRSIPGSVPALGAWPPGCPFHPRCELASEACRVESIQLHVVGAGRTSRCIHADLVGVTSDT